MRMQIGDTFGKLTVIDKAVSKPRSPKYTVQCECGNVIDVFGVALRQGRTISCGCRRKEAIAEYSKSKRLDYGMAAAKKLFDGYKRRATKGFELTLEEFLAITKQDCYYCGVKPSQVVDLKRNGYGTYTYNGIDRLDNNKGYTKENAIAACGMCNMMKRHYSKEQFLHHIALILEHQQEKENGREPFGK